MAHNQHRLPAEWEQQSATLLAWPAANSDWHSQLGAVREEYRALIKAILQFQSVVLLVPADEPAPDDLPTGRSELHLLPVKYNDTWCRDYGPVTLVHAGQRLAMDFQFNAWGGKFQSTLDNRVNTHLARHELFRQFDFRQSLFELEGGAIDCDGQGWLLVNWHCLRLRHPHLNDREINYELHDLLKIDQVIGIDIEGSPGDDTDGHIDTLARFISSDTIVYQTQSSRARNDLLRGQLESLRNRAGREYRLVALPAIDDITPAGPASYVNFLFVNGACLVPAFGSRHDGPAREVLAELLPERSIVPVPAATMISQSGGPHCAAMQIPAALH